MITVRCRVFNHQTNQLIEKTHRRQMDVREATEEHLVAIPTEEIFLYTFRMVEKFKNEFENHDDGLLVLVDDRMERFEASSLDEFDFQGSTIVVFT